MTWDTDYKAKRTTFRGVEYDSVLEADWAASMTAWGMDFVYHPGRVYLDKDVYEPDFQLDGDIILEVKGGHNERIDKAYRLESELGIPVIIGRAGFLPPGADIEYAGAVWESPGRDHEYGLRVSSSGSRFLRADPAVDGDAYFWTAPLAYAHQLSGVRFFKALEDSWV